MCDPQEILISPLGFGLLFPFCGMGCLLAVPLTLAALVAARFGCVRRPVRRRSLRRLDGF